MLTRHYLAMIGLDQDPVDEKPARELELEVERERKGAERR
jgi:hypothetical protein